MQFCNRPFADLKKIHHCKTLLEQNDTSLKGFTRLLGIAGNNIRLMILYLLVREKELCVCDISNVIGLNVSPVSQHLRKMKDGNLVKTRRDGQVIYYSLCTDKIKWVNSLFSCIEKEEKQLLKNKIM